MKDAPFLEPWRFLPHRAPMILIDRITQLTPDLIESEVKIHETSAFYRQGGVPAWVGVEYMAQTTAAFGGYEASERGEDARVGFLLATRNYRANVGAFALGLALRVRVTLVHRDAGGLSMVESVIVTDKSDEPLVTGTLTVYDVKDLSQFLRGGGGAK